MRRIEPRVGMWVEIGFDKEELTLGILVVCQALEGRYMIICPTGDEVTFHGYRETPGRYVRVVPRLDIPPAWGPGGAAYTDTDLEEAVVEDRGLIIYTDIYRAPYPAGTRVHRYVSDWEPNT